MNLRFELNEGVEVFVIDATTFDTSAAKLSKVFATFLLSHFFSLFSLSLSYSLSPQNNHYSFPRGNRAIQHRNPRYSERFDSATTNPKAQRISTARIIIGAGKTNVSFGPRFLGRRYLDRLSFHCLGNATPKA